jgi:hypothetical protein
MQVADLMPLGPKPKPAVVIFKHQGRIVYVGHTKNALIYYWELGDRYSWIWDLIVDKDSLEFELCKTVSEAAAKAANLRRNHKPKYNCQTEFKTIRIELSESTLKAAERALEHLQYNTLNQFMKGVFEEWLTESGYLK